MRANTGYFISLGTALTCAVVLFKLPVLAVHQLNQNKKAGMKNKNALEVLN